MARSATRRDDILEAAADIFVERGFDAATTREIGERAGVLSGSLYHHFETKEEMLFTLVQDVYSEILASHEELLDAPGSGAERLRLLVEAHVRHLIANLARTTLALHESRSLSEQHRNVIADAEARYLAVVAELIEQGREDGSLRADADPRLARLVVLGAANWVYRWYSETGDRTPDEIADAIASLAVDGLTAPSHRREGEGNVAPVRR